MKPNKLIALPLFMALFSCNSDKKKQKNYSNAQNLLSQQVITV